MFSDHDKKPIKSERIMRATKPQPHKPIGPKKQKKAG
jgi:hypothetical protein